LFGIIDGLLLIRLLLKLLGSNPHAGFTNFVYGVTDVLMALLRKLVLTFGSSDAVLDVGRHRDHRLRLNRVGAGAFDCDRLLPQRDGFRKAAREASAGHVHPDGRT
jgi:YGGT family